MSVCLSPGRVHTKTGILRTGLDFALLFERDCGMIWVQNRGTQGPFCRTSRSGSEVVRISGGAAPRCLFSSLSDELDGIHTRAVFQNLEMQIRAGRSAGIAHERNGLAFFDFVPYGDKIL